MLVACVDILVQDRPMRFLPVLLVLLLLALVGSLTACDSGSPSPDTLQTGFEPTDFIYAEVDIADLQARMQKGELDSRTLTQAYLDRIAAIDREGPQLNSIIEINPD